MTINEIRSSREFMYYFEEESEVMLDLSVMNDVELLLYKDVVNKKGIVKKCWSDLHAFGMGSSYMHNVEFDGVLYDGKCFDGNTFAPNYIPTELLIEYKNK